MIQSRQSLSISSEVSCTVSLQRAPLVDLMKEPNFILQVITIVKRIFSHHLRMKITIIEKQQSLNKLKASLKFSIYIYIIYIF